MWKLTACDLCEIARNSVMQSGFPHDTKRHWVADEYWLPGPAGNDMRKTNVPNIRMQFRLDVLTTEQQLITNGAARCARGSGAARVCEQRGRAPLALLCVCVHVCVG